MTRLLLIGLFAAILGMFQPPADADEVRCPEIAKDPEKYVCCVSQNRVCGVEGPSQIKITRPSDPILEANLP